MKGEKKTKSKQVYGFLKSVYVFRQRGCCRKVDVVLAHPLLISSLVPNQLIYCWLSPHFSGNVWKDRNEEVKGTAENLQPELETAG